MKGQQHRRRLQRLIRTGISPTPVSIQNLFISLSSSLQFYQCSPAKTRNLCRRIAPSDDFTHVPVQQIVKILHRHKLRPAIALRRKLHSRKLVRPHAAGTNVPNLPTLNKIMESLHRFLDRHSLVKAMDLEKIDVICIEAFERRIDRGEDTLAGETSLVDIVHRLVDVLESHYLSAVTFADSTAALGADDQLMARDVVFLDCLCDDLLRLTVAVDIGCVPGV